MSDGAYLDLERIAFEKRDRAFDIVFRVAPKAIEEAFADLAWEALHHEDAADLWTLGDVCEQLGRALLETGDIARRRSERIEGRH